MKNYDSSWDEGNEDAWDGKYDEWSEREWDAWLSINFSFPFEVKRIEDDREFILKDNDANLFTIGHIF